MKAALLLAALALPAAAHEMRLEQASSPAAIVRLSYADGQPFAFEAYELYPAGSATPAQVGRTNAEGQIVFLPGQSAQWRLKAFSADGHGVDRTLAVSLAPAASAPPADAAPARWSLALAGIGAILGLFGIVQLALRKKQ